MTRYFILILGLFWGLWLWLVGAGPVPIQQPFTVAIAPNQILTGRLYLPANTTAPVPALLLCHGVNSSKDTLAPLAQALARRQIAAVVFDFGGYGQSYRRPNDPSANLQEATAFLQWMRQQPQLGELGIGGHSMGGITALELAKSNPDLRATILLSILGPATPSVPHNLWVGSGVYEELNPVGQMQDLFASAVEGEVTPFSTVGDFAAGTARRLFFSPSVDHAVAPYDLALQTEIVAWAEQAFGLPATNQPVRTQRQLLGQVLAVGCVLGLGSALYTSLSSSLWIRASLGLALLVLLWLPGAWGAGVSLVGVGILLGGNYGDRLRNTQKPPRPRLFLYGGLCFGLGLLAITANAALTGSLLQMPRAILGLPMLAKTLTVGLLYDRFHMVRYGLESPVGMGLMVGVVVLEGFKPGWVLANLGHRANRLINALR
ncbi:MAG: alpha/beta hydrolase [Leptolyngbyaceae cyanobacterium]